MNPLGELRKASCVAGDILLIFVICREFKGILSTVKAFIRGKESLT